MSQLFDSRSESVKPDCIAQPRTSFVLPRTIMRDCYTAGGSGNTCIPTGNWQGSDDTTTRRGSRGANVHGHATTDDVSSRTDRTLAPGGPASGPAWGADKLESSGCPRLGRLREGTPEGGGFRRQFRRQRQSPRGSQPRLSRFPPRSASPQAAARLPADTKGARRPSLQRRTYSPSWLHQPGRWQVLAKERATGGSVLKAQLSSWVTRELYHENARPGRGKGRHLFPDSADYIYSLLYFFYVSAIIFCPFQLFSICTFSVHWILLSAIYSLDMTVWYWLPQPICSLLR